MSRARADLGDAIDALVAAASSTDTTASGGSSPASDTTASAAATARPTATTTAPATKAASGASRGGMTIAQAQAAIAAAQLDLTSAQLARDQSTLVAPVSGTLATMPWAVGDTATASETVTVIATGSVQVTVSIPEATIRNVKVGQSAQVTSATGTVSEGTVSAIGLLPSSTSSTVTYPVAVAAPLPGLVAGTTATAVITTAAATDAVIVPLSAVTLTGVRSGTVSVLGADGKANTTQVAIGVVGATQVQVTQGLGAGTQVVLADTTQPIPTDTNIRFRTGGSSLTGGSAGGPPGGMPAGGMPVAPPR